MTEDFAKTKWCPFVRHLDSGGGTFNRGAEPGNAINGGRENGHWSCACIGADCMAWRRKKPNSTEGYCGLVGTPWVTP